MLTQETGEIRFIAELQRRGYKNIERSEGYFPDWDIKTERGTFEIKEDALAPKTGRIFIEYLYKGNPSGLAYTKADYFVVIVSDLAHIAPSRNWKEFLRESWKYLDKARGGDNLWSQGVFIKLEYLDPSKIASLVTWRL
jgi:hypothetical protein